MFEGHRKMPLSAHNRSFVAYQNGGKIRERGKLLKPNFLDPVELNNKII